MILTCGATTSAPLDQRRRGSAARARFWCGERRDSRAASAEMRRTARAVFVFIFYFYF
jgi:hypothetical protein